MRKDCERLEQEIADMERHLASIMEERSQQR
jgi:hypothetical protein